MGKTKNEKKQRRERERPNRQERKDLAAAAAAAAGAAPAAAEAQGDDDVAMGSASDRAGPGDDDVSMGASSSSWAGGAAAAQSGHWSWWEQQQGDDNDGAAQSSGHWSWWEQQQQQGHDNDGAAQSGHWSWWEQQQQGDDDNDGAAESGNWSWWEWWEPEVPEAAAEVPGEAAAEVPGAGEAAAEVPDEAADEAWGTWQPAAVPSGEAASGEAASSLRSAAPPTFDPNCRGTARDWNLATTVIVSKRTRSGLPGGAEWPLLGQPLRAGEVDLWLKKFLSSRPGPSGESLAGRLGCATAQPGGWWRVPWVLEQESPPFFAAGADIRKGWHGCKMEALYSIIYHGRIFESADEAQGHRYFADRPGVYLHADSRAQKAENYINYVGMSGDGIFWAAKWEVLYDVSGSVKGKKATDQLIYAGGAVRLSALFLATHTRESLPTSCHVTEWQPLLESNPTA